LYAGIKLAILNFTNVIKFSAVRC